MKRARLAALALLGLAASSPAAASDPPLIPVAPPGQAPATEALAATRAPPTGPESKKQRFLREKAETAAAPTERARWRQALRRRVGKKPTGLINIYNTWTHEFVAVDEGRAGAPPTSALVSRFFRCHFTNHEIAMDARLFGALLKAANHFRVQRVDIVSGFRAPKYNLMLRKKGRRVARESEHTFGHAVDFRLPGITTERLRTWARRLRMGGVGYYRDDGFVHMDVGRVRYWAE